jgi:chromosome segregation ATPase
VVAFIILQLAGLTIAGYYPALVNYLPKLIYFTSDNAPPPINPKFQVCLEEYVFDIYENEAGVLRSSVATAQSLNVSYLPAKQQDRFAETHQRVLATHALIDTIHSSERDLSAFVIDYRPLHEDVRLLQRKIKFINRDIEAEERKIRQRNRDGETMSEDITKMNNQIAELEAKKYQLESQIPSHWQAEREKYLTFANAEDKARKLYRRNADEAYEPVVELQKLISLHEELTSIESDLLGLKAIIANESSGEAVAKIKLVERRLGNVSGASEIRSKISKARRALKKGSDREKAGLLLQQALVLFADEVAWRQRAAVELSAGLINYENALRSSVGARMQEKLSEGQAKYIASCLADHKDISLAF